jgi:hypothetical protein
VIQLWATGWIIGGSSPGRGWEFFSSPPRPDRLWSPSSLLSNGYQLFPWRYNGRGVKLTTHLHLVPRSKLHGSIPSLHIEWCSVKEQGQLYPGSLCYMTWNMKQRKVKA